MLLWIRAFSSSWALPATGRRFKILCKSCPTALNQYHSAISGTTRETGRLEFPIAFLIGLRDNCIQLGKQRAVLTSEAKIRVAAIAKHIEFQTTLSSPIV